MQKVGKYEIAGVFGSGGMATVYRARDPMLDREVAIKVISLQRVREPAYLDRFLREARAVAALSHPNILPVYDLAREGEALYFVMPVVAGGSLRDRIQQGPVALPETAAILSQVASALDHAHQAGIVHRDVKPENILFDRNGKPYLADFGVARLLDTDSERNLTKAGFIIGTLSYLAPEVIQGKQADARADIFALGVLAFQMLTGQVPFSGTTTASVLHSIVTSETPSVHALVPELPPDLDAEFVRALAKDPAERFQRAGEFSAALARVAGSAPRPIPPAPRAAAEPSPAGPMSPGTPAGRPEATIVNAKPRARSPWLLVSLAAFALILVLGALGFLRVGLPESILILAGCAFLLARHFHLRRKPSGVQRAGLPKEPASALEVPAREEPAQPEPSAQVEINQTVIMAAPAAAPHSEPQHEDSTRIFPLASAQGADSSQPESPGVALTILQSADAQQVGRSVPLSRFPFRLGRTNGDLMFPGDPGISRDHALIESSNGMFTIRDGGSTNGTWVDGKRIPPASPAVLLFGSTIRLSPATAVSFVHTNARPLPDLAGAEIEKRYLLKELLRSTVKSALYTAKDLKLPQDVAVKLLAPDYAAHPSYREQFEREAMTAAQLRHPHICKVVDYGQTLLTAPGAARQAPLSLSYLCLELMRGGSLASRLNPAGPVPPDRAAAWLGSLGEALDYAHGKGFLHSGIKPSSIVFDENDHPCLTDFAIAYRPEETSAASAIVGAPAFLAPEQWENQPPCPATDQYALASVFYLLLSGSRPYEGQENPDVRRKNYLRGPVPVHKEAAESGRPPLPPALSEIFARALARRPEDRFPSVSEFARAVARAAAGGPSRPAQPRVFLSYRRESSAAWAITFGRELKDKYGIGAFVDTQRVDSAGRFPQRIQRAIEECDVFVCLLGEGTLASHWVDREVRLAWESRKPMIPVFQEGYVPPGQGQELAQHLEALITYDGVHLFDVRNIHVDHTISDLAEMVKRTIEKSLREQDDPSFNG